ncbi:phosphomannomutase [Mesorhizobium sp. LHD-90]|uniref:phosphomannomutase n=1 Tax=Mesorhizobium sp. LHD-90 TaxID=3071414 RepID=UPI0027DF7F77|nr:phosphomannomutase [Mesorhizobium sp. LHD-90]MDQ6434984.1 phosphomannomutase [Mesorhizobium sp. LHD-90]
MVAFGTSGLRGLATDLLAGPGYVHVSAFASHMLSAGIASGGKVLVGCDRRDSSPGLTRQSLAALGEAGLAPIYCGVLPTPALALHALTLAVPAVMVTGSHIPPDRNGLKFYRPDGEIDKADERSIAARAAEAAIPPAVRLASLPALPAPHGEALRLYVARYKAAFAEPLLAGMRVGVYRHSSVAADVLEEIAAWLGATVVRLGESGGFVAVDTEAIDASMAARLADWSKAHKLDAIISADGDGDRPLMTDETGRVIRGDALGLVAAQFLKADAVVTPVSSNPGISAGGGFDVIRTKVGSPFVLEGMAKAIESGFSRVIGFEANGGLLLGTDFAVGGAALAALPTRDSVLPILCAFASARAAGVPLSKLVDDLALPTCLSGRVENYARPDSDRLMADLRASNDNIRIFLSGLGLLSGIEDIDGLQIHLEDGGMIHLRPSGNAPEMRCYVSAPTVERAEALLRAGLSRIEDFAGGASGVKS